MSVNGRLGRAAVLLATVALTGCGGAGSGSGGTTGPSTSVTGAGPSANGGQASLSASAPGADPAARLHSFADAIAKASGAEGAVFAATSASGDALSLAVVKDGKITVWAVDAGHAPAAKADYPADAAALSVKPLPAWPWDRLIDAARAVRCDKTAVLNSWTTRGDAFYSLGGCPTGGGAQQTVDRYTAFLDERPLPKVEDPFSEASVKQLLWEARATSPKGRARQIELGDMHDKVAMTVMPAPGSDGRGQLCRVDWWARARDYTTARLFVVPRGCDKENVGKRPEWGGPPFDVATVSPSAVSAAIAEAERRFGAPMRDAAQVNLMQVNGRVCLKVLAGTPYRSEIIPLGTR